jgi:N,N-dimethylformamidase beta subunit-like protein
MGRRRRELAIMRPRPFGLAITVLLSAFASTATATTLTQTENAKAGDISWKITNPARNNEIEGYGSAPSVNRGDSITFSVNTASLEYKLEVFRMGWYGGAGARKMQAAVTLPGTQQPIPAADPVTGLIECNWAASYVLQVPNNTADPTDWMSGIYLVKLTALDSGKQRYIIFVVRDDSRPSDFLFQNSITTYQAYNAWGGRSLYTSPRAFKVSFNRPIQHGLGAGDFVNWGWELHMLRFLEREGYDVTYTTDVDTHAHGDLLLQHKAFLSVGHDEYWSWQMRDNVEQARDRGVSLGFFGANAAYWQVRFEPSTFTGDANRTMVSYKSAKLDPMSQTGNAADLRFVTTKFRLPPVNRPEDSMIGVMYESGNIGVNDLVVNNPSHWILEGTGLQSGDHLTGLLGYEADRVFGNAPRGTLPVTHSPYLANNITSDGCDAVSLPNCITRFADMTSYNAESGATVVATGSMHWNWGLDKFPPNPLSQANVFAQQATRNILNRFLNPPPFYLEPRNVIFAPQIIGTVKKREIVIVNRQADPFTIGQVNDGPDFQSQNGCPSSLGSGQRCVIEVSYTPHALVTSQGGASFTLTGSVNETIRVPFTGMGSDFALSTAQASDTTATLNSSGGAQFQLRLDSVGLVDTVALSCQGAFKLFSCLVDPPSVTFNGNASQAVTVKLRQTASISSSIPKVFSPQAHPSLRRIVFALLPAFMVAVSVLMVRPRVRPVLAVAFIVAMFCAACSHTESQPAVATNEQPVSFHFRVDATSVGITRSVNLELILQQPQK